MDNVGSGRFILLVGKGKTFQPVVERFMSPTVEAAHVVGFRDCLHSRQWSSLVGHQRCSRTVGSAKSLLSLGFTLTGLSSASLNLCQSLEVSSKCRASAISCAARTHALSRMKFVIFT